MWGLVRTTEPVYLTPLTYETRITDGTTEDSWCCPEFTTCGTERADCLWPNPNLLLVDDDGGGSGGNETGLGTDLEGGGLTGDGSDSPSGNTDVTDTSNSTSNSAAAAPTGVSPGIIAGASIAGVVVVACLLLFLFCRRRRRRKRALPLEEKKISQERWDNAELDAQGDAVERKPHREDSGLQVTSITGWKRWKSRKHQEGGNEPVELDSNQVVVELDHDGARVGAELEEEQKEKFRLEMGSGRDGEVS